MDKLIEELSDLEHDQWVKWSRVTFLKLDDFTIDEIVNKWRPNWKPYSELPEEEKEKDRIFARKVIERLIEWLEVEGHYDLKRIIEVELDGS